MRPIIVVSAINLFEGGPLTILKECLEYLSENLCDQFKIVALVHDIKLVNIKNIEYIAYPKSRKSWFFRVYYEYFHFIFLSKRIKPYIWLSLHDITPNVTADIRAVYCHNSSPFYPFSFRALLYSYQVALFSIFYKFLYRINIKKNNFVIVQQDWMRKEFLKMFGLKNVVVAYPSIVQPSFPEVQIKTLPKTVFIYPAFARVFKNFEIVAEAAKLLHGEGRTDFEVVFTIDSFSNKFARHIVSVYKDVPVISFAGCRSRDEIYRMYQQASCLIFPSKLETWGLPITEAKQFKLPMLLADLPYARETVGSYDRVKFFDPDDHMQLAEYMKSVIDGTMVYPGSKAECIQSPFARNWGELFKILLSAEGASNA